MFTVLECNSGYSSMVPVNPSRDFHFALCIDDLRRGYPKRRITNSSVNYNAYQSRKGHEIIILSDEVKV